MKTEVYLDGASLQLIHGENEFSIELDQDKIVELAEFLTKTEEE